VANIPIGAELARPFMPAKDFDVSKRFYEALGFREGSRRRGRYLQGWLRGFILQRYFQEDWAGNFAMQLNG